VQVTAQTLHRLMEEGIPVLFATRGGWFLGRALGGDTKNVELRAAQYRAVNDSARALHVARAIVHTKISNSRTMLRRNHRAPPRVALFEIKQLARKALEAESIDTLLGIEGSAARVYFREFTGMLKTDLEDFDFEGRNRRPPRDPINALLSFCYGLLVRETTMAAHAVGLDPLLGLYHQSRFGRASLALDLMEEFRPILADSTVISVINNGVVDGSDFIRGHGACALKPPARKRVVQAMERRIDQLVTHPVFDYRLSYRRVLEVQARLLSRLLMGEIDAYPGFRVR
jgi:CRISPR-associated protein Cas1